MKTLPLGKGMPALGLGTWKAARGEVGAAVKEAVRLGYRHIDCAAVYGNEAEIGEALAELFDEGAVKREELWITSKLWNHSHHPDDVRPALEKTLSDLRLESLDLYLIHWPVVHPRGVAMPKKGSGFIALEQLPIRVTWEALEKCVESGLTGHIGVSNFSIKKLESLIADSRIKPAVNQIEMHPYLQQTEMLDFCADQGVFLTAYSPLGSTDRPDAMKKEGEPLLFEDEVIVDIAEQLGVTPAQVLLAWAVERGTSVIPKSTNSKRQAENLAAADLELDDEVMTRLAALDKHRRYLEPDVFVREGSPYTFENLWDE